MRSFSASTCCSLVLLVLVSLLDPLSAAYRKIDIKNPGFEAPTLGSGQIPDPALSDGNYRAWSSTYQGIQEWNPEGDTSQFGLYNPSVAATLDGSGANGSTLCMVFIGGQNCCINQGTGHLLRTQTTYRLTAYIGARADIGKRSWRLQMVTKNSSFVITDWKEVVDEEGGSSSWQNTFTLGGFKKVELIWKTGAAPVGLGDQLYVRFVEDLNEVGQVMLDDVTLEYDDGSGPAPEETEMAAVTSLDGRMRISLSSNGNVISMRSDGVDFKCLGQTELVNTSTSNLIYTKIDNDHHQFTKTIKDSSTGSKCTLTELFSAASNTVNWKLDIVGASSSPWSTSIVTRWNWRDSPTDKFWTAWTSPNNGSLDFRDPYILRPFEDRVQSYGGSQLDQPNVFCIPIATVGGIRKNFFRDMMNDNPAGRWSTANGMVWNFTPAIEGNAALKLWKNSGTEGSIGVSANCDLSWYATNAGRFNFKLRGQSDTRSDWGLLQIVFLSLDEGQFKSPLIRIGNTETWRSISLRLSEFKSSLNINNGAPSWSKITGVIVKVTDPSNGNVVLDSMEVVPAPGQTAPAEWTNGRGISLVMDPSNTVIDMSLLTSSAGNIEFSRQHNRIVNTNMITFSMDFVPHGNDFRGGLAYMVKRWPGYFEPKGTNACELAGSASYAQGLQVDPKLFQKLGFGQNWNAEFDWPYLGMFMPTVSPVTVWTSFLGNPTSKQKMNNYAGWMRKNGFHVQGYFNIFEFGSYMNEPARWPVVSGTNLWRNPILYYQTYFPNAVLRDNASNPIATWEWGLTFDPGDTEYQDYLISQAQSQLSDVPNQTGFNLDRLDWLGYFNIFADDPAIWYNGAPARKLTRSWISLMDRIGPIMHNGGKSILVNPGCKRIDVMRQVDGFHIESGGDPGLLGASFLALCKPAYTWLSDAGAVNNCDTFLQRRLYMGVFPHAPMPGGDHCINDGPSSYSNQLAYAPLFDVFRGEKRMVLLDNVIQVEGGSALANIFEMPFGYAVPVICGPTYPAGGPNPEISVTINRLDELAHARDCIVEYRIPNDTQWHSVTPQINGQSMKITVPLGSFKNETEPYFGWVLQSCVMIRLVHTTITPEERYFSSDQSTYSLSTVLSGNIRYTLDGSAPTASSPVYSSAITIRSQTKIKWAVFSGSTRTTRVSVREISKVQASSPVIDTYYKNRFYTNSLTAKITVPYEDAPGAKVRFTLDGTDPTTNSMVYSNSLLFNKTFSTVPVLNSGFELPVLDAGGSPLAPLADGAFLAWSSMSTGVQGWSAAGNTASIGLFDPTPSVTTNGKAANSSDNCIVIFDGPNSMIEKDSGWVLRPNTVYRLTAYIGKRADVATRSWRLQLISRDTNNTITDWKEIVDESGGASSWQNTVVAGSFKKVELLWTNGSAPVGLSNRLCVRFLTDGSEAASQVMIDDVSLEYETETQIVKASTFVSGFEPSLVSMVNIYRVNHIPVPEIQISDLPITDVICGRFCSQKDKNSGDGGPLALDGIVYSKGVGCYSRSEFKVPYQSTYKRFVSVIGIDDFLLPGAPEKSGTRVYFEVWADSTRIYRSPMMWRNDVNFVDVDIPAGSTWIRFVVDQASDLDHRDIADWCNAGFVSTPR